MELLEKSINGIQQKANLERAGNLSTDVQSRKELDFDYLFYLLEGCRKDQDSKRGRYEFLKSFQDAIDAGFAYTEELLQASLDDNDLAGHRDLNKWAAMTSQKLQSLKARVEDYTTRVDNASFKVSDHGARMSIERFPDSL